MILTESTEDTPGNIDSAKAFREGENEVWVKK